MAQSFGARRPSAHISRTSSCLRRKLIVEADGGQHVDNRRDAVRDQWLEREGYLVVRYSNIDILKNPEGVLTDLLSHLSAK